MKVLVQLPPGLSRYSDGEEFHESTAQTVGEVLADLVERFPELESRLLDPTREMRSYLMVFRNGEVMPRDTMSQCELSDGDTVRLMFMAGGG